MSLSIALANALSGLQVNQTALQVTTSNVANVNTPDYARKIHEQQSRVLGGQGYGVETAQIIRRIDDHHAQLVNRDRHGHMIIPGQTLYVLECEPAVYSALAANEAEKAAEINILEVRSFGSMGRMYLAGEERDIDVGWRAAVAALEGVSGREKS